MSFEKAMFYNILFLCCLSLFFSCSDSGQKNAHDASVKKTDDSSQGNKDVFILTDNSATSDSNSTDDSGISDSTGIPSITGDWFECIDDDCKELSFFGVRFNKDGYYTRLFSSTPRYRTGENYCFLSRETFRSGYVLRGERLTLYQQETGFKYELLWKIKGGIAEAAFGEKTWKSKKVSSPKIQGPCKERKKLICARLRPHGTDGICDWEFNCDQGDYTLSCTQQTNGNYFCQCETDSTTNAEKEFRANRNICEKGTVTDPVTFASKNCNWDIWMPEMFDQPQSAELF
jgi:hypothetical protein